MIICIFIVLYMIIYIVYCIIIYILFMIPILFLFICMFYIFQILALLWKQWLIWLLGLYITVHELWFSTNYPKSLIAVTETLPLCLSSTDIFISNPQRSFLSLFLHHLLVGMSQGVWDWSTHICWPFLPEVHHHSKILSYLVCSNYLSPVVTHS